MTGRILEGCALDVLASLANESVQCCVTSPPYWGLRDYGVAASVWGGRVDCDHKWGDIGRRHRGGRSGDSPATNGRKARAVRDAIRDVNTGQFCQECDAWRGALGLEPTPELFVEHMVLVFREVRRVLRKDGTLWLNIGDSYTDSGRGADTGSTLSGSRDNQRESRKTRVRESTRTGLAPKNLVGVPWMLAFALRADGWILRSDIIWHKPNPMPEAVKDRPTKAHEYIFLLSKSPRYYYDQEATLEPVSENTHARVSQDVAAQIGSQRANGGTRSDRPMKAVVRHVPGAKAKQVAAGSGIKQNSDFVSAVSLLVAKRNKRSVWTVTTCGYREAHFATFPPKLIEPCILAPAHC
jgi:DNA modification methylase